MINELEIKNFKCFEQISFKDFKRVNLFTGKNNSGKSSALEAISLFCAEGNINWIIKILENRGENIPKFTINDLDGYLEYEKTEYLSNIFHKKNIDEQVEFTSKIGSYDNIPKAKFKKISINIEKVKRRKKENSTPISINSINIFKSDDNNHLSDNFNIDFSVNLENYKNWDAEKLKLPKISFLDSKEKNITYNGEIWDKISLNEEEKSIVKGLNILDKNIEKLSFINAENGNLNSFKRIPIVKIKGEKNPVKLQTMGDGINKILNIILNLVNSENGYLFIDEFENGLHYSVQEKLWEIIFELSNKLNVQVFATTHSNDAIVSFAKVLQKKAEYDGSLIRLQKVKDGSIMPFNFTEAEIIVAAEQNINIR